MLKAHIVKRRRELVIDVSLELEEGGSLGLFGTSGAGKSTILACLAGIEEPDEGYVRMGADQYFPPSLPLHQRRVGFLTQEPGLFPHLSVRENVLFGLRDNRGRDPDQARWLAELRARLQLDAFWDAPATSISGGQARRVGLARTLARRPRLVLLDEPFAGLDRQLTRELIDALLLWNRSLGFSMIAVDHGAEVLQRLCPQQVLVLEAGEVVQRGTWSELHERPATPLLRSLLTPL